VAIAPMAIDMLTMKAQLDWTEKMYGQPSDQIRDYTDLNLHRKLDDPPMQTLRVGRSLQLPSELDDAQAPVARGLMILIESSTRYVTTGAICQSQSSSSKRRTPGTIQWEVTTPGKRWPPGFK
jgi:hypothetical protein